MIEFFILILLSVVSLITMCFICFTDNLFAAAMGSALISLFVSIIFVILKAPDVAMTEAAIGAALSSAIIIGIIVKVRREK